MSPEELLALVEGASEQELRALLCAIRQQRKIVLHPLEAKWNTTAEAILEAIDQAADLTQRGIRGILAEATFNTEVVPKWAPDWTALPVDGEAYDAHVTDGAGEIRIQVKLQRRERGVPKLYSSRGFQRRDDVYAVETQRTRNGIDAGGGGATRPYRVDEFDVLAVCLQPLTTQWSDFRYCAVRDLLVRPDSPTLLAVMQPLYLNGTHGWTDDFRAAARRARQPMA